MSTTPSHGPLRIGVFLVTLAAAALLAATPARASGSTSAVCTYRLTVAITPGMTMIPSSGTISSHGQTGSITCLGTIGGARVTGPGSIGADETYTAATCVSHASSGTARISVPTTAGAKHLFGTLTVQRTALVFREDIRFANARFSGIGVAILTKGTCFVTPLREVLAVVTGSLSGT